MKTINGIVKNMTDVQLQESYFEIKDLNRTGVLLNGVVRQIHNEFELVTECEQNLRTVEDAILFEIAKRKYE